METLTAGDVVAIAKRYHQLVAENAALAQEKRELKIAIAENEYQLAPIREMQAKVSELEMQRTALCAAAGINPSGPFPTLAKQPTALEELERINDPAKRTKFYLSHKKEIRAAQLQQRIENEKRTNS